ncbi:PQQ-binding-like beta-propeller repeat protein [Streptomyces avermitilis]|uniref:PQQ-binding-like beta-propeller repeat protein n=1 Tax=Streptomyces avermitilis TaxID=33903 RepID=UPI0036C0EAA4
MTRPAHAPSNKDIMAPSAPGIRHDPLKTVLPLEGAHPSVFRWATEPAVSGYARLLHHSDHKGPGLPVPVCASPVALPGVGVVVGTFNGRVRLYDRSLSKTYWEIRLGAPIYASLVADRSRRRVVVATTEGQVVCLDLRGRLVWQAQTGVRIYATPTIVPGADLLVIAAFESHCLGIDLATGRQLFARELPRPWHVGHGSAAHRDPYASPVTTPASTAVIACAEHVLCMGADGKQRWQHEVGHAIKASPAVLPGRAEVAVCSVDGRCLFLDAVSGTPRGELKLGGKVVASPAVSGRFLVVGTQDGTAYGIDVERRAIVWTAPGYGAREYTSFTLLPDSNFTAVTVRGNAVGLRREDGQFLWETSQVLGLTDHDPAMDVTPVAGHDGSMYCGSYSGMLYHFRFRPAETEGKHV